LLRSTAAFQFATNRSLAWRSPPGSKVLSTRRADATASYGELALAGNAAHLTAITLAQSDKMRTEITLSPPRLFPAFSPADLARYFR
jgi:hypothetical protein